MYQVVRKWFNRYFSDPEAVFMFFVLIGAVIVFRIMGNILVPIIASIIIAYMLSGFVRRLKQWKVPDLLAVILVYLLFLSLFLVLIIWLLPILAQQLTNLVAEVPHMVNSGQKYLIELQARHPEFFSAGQLKSFFAQFNSYLTQAGQYILSHSLTSIGNTITIIIYFILVPLLVFFFLKDRHALVTWFEQFLPAKRAAITQIWHEVDKKNGDYIRGKIIEIVIVAFVSVVAFLFMGLNYAALLGFCVGLSVIVPYIGAVLVTIPVVIVGLIQWGWSAYFAYLIIVYAIIIALDANLLVPLLFSETMKIHPVVIILAVLLFGGIWGFWGVFFAIPLATLVHALLKGWPRSIVQE